MNRSLIMKTLRSACLILSATAVLGLSACSFFLKDKNDDDNGKTDVGGEDGGNLPEDNGGEGNLPEDNGGKPSTPSVTISHESVELAVDMTVMLSATASDGTEITWTSSDESVATIADSGTVMGINVGEAVIYARSETATAQCLVTVISKNAYGRELIWHDEFDGDSLDTDKWGYQTGVQDFYGSSTGPIYWGNNELQYYTEDAVTLADGCLNITATREDMGNGRTYSSARITTRDKFSTTYGYIEAKIKSPAIDGMWPAFWMLPQPTDASSSNNIYGWWAANGEIDIMEAKGRLKNVVDATLHYGNLNTSTYKTTSYTMSETTEEWHVFALEWEADHIAWFVDDVEIFRVTSDQWWTSAVSNEENPSAPFDQPFYILLNLAVGGNYDNQTKPDSSFTSATMSVDYVRVYSI